MAKSLRFIQCGDLHLGSPFHNLAAIDERWQRIVGKAPVRAFQKIVQMAIDKRVHAVLITGDVYTSADHNLTAQLDYVRLLHKLAQNNIQVFAVLGNHDPLEAWKAKIPFPPNVHIFPTESVERVPLVIDGEEVAAMARVMLRANSGKTWPGNSTVPLVTVFLSVCSILRSAAGNRRMRHVPWKI